MSTHKGSLITDATACPQDIAFPTNLDLLNDAREKSEELMDILFEVSTMQKKAKKLSRKSLKRVSKSSTKKGKNKKRYSYFFETTVRIFGKKYSLDRENFIYIGGYSIKEKLIQISICHSASLSATKNDV